MTASGGLLPHGESSRSYPIETPFQNQPTPTAGIASRGGGRIAPKFFGLTGNQWVPYKREPYGFLLLA